MSESVTVSKVFVGGILLEIHSHCDSLDSHLPVHALFLLHGRTLSTESVAPIAKSILELSYSLGGSNRKKDLIIITYASTPAWLLARPPAKPRMAQGPNQEQSSTCVSPVAPTDIRRVLSSVDMYAIQTGTAHEITFLIDHLPAYIYPQVERSIVEWGVAGISLGGHSAWIALAHEPRLQLAIPIIGCPDFTRLMSQRARLVGVPFVPPYYPLHLKAYVDAYDPASLQYRENVVTNPFLGKRILVLSGAKDKIVPWSASQEFAEGLEVGDGVKKVVLEDNARHECTPTMVREAALFVTDWLAK